MASFKLKKIEQVNGNNEFKTRHLRVYSFQDKGTGKIVVCAGTKNTQKSDIKHFRKLKKEYLNNR